MSEEGRDNAKNIEAQSTSYLTEAIWPAPALRAGIPEWTVVEHVIQELVGVERLSNNASICILILTIRDLSIPCRDGWLFRRGRRAAKRADLSGHVKACRW